MGEQGGVTDLDSLEDAPSLVTIEKLNANRVVTSAATLVVSVSVCRQISMQYIHEYFVA